MTKGQRVMNGTNDRDCGTVLQVGDDCNGPVLVRWDNTGEETWQGADCLYSVRAQRGSVEALSTSQGD